MAIVWLTPQMEQLFQEGASAGRKFLDRLVYSFDSEHASRINEYEFAMRERNRLLQNNHADGTWLEALEQTMAETGAAIAQARLNTVQHINYAIQHSPLSFPKAHISIAGVVEDLLALGTPSVQVEEDFKRILRAGRPQDAASGRTLPGTHRSEMKVIHIEKQMPAQLCSTGEQKALLLSIVLAEARAGAQWHGVIPVLLLDEVVAHLDVTRRLELFEEICQIGAQTWMTGTDSSLFTGLEGKAQYYQVDGGLIIPTQG
jgi:DNA replication and repair protein RecF